VLGGVEWELVSATGQLVAKLDKPSRDVTIAWDSGDRSLYLSVIAPPVANVEGSQQRLYTAPLSLLAALLIVPARFHATLAKTVQDARVEAESTAMAHVATAVEKLPRPWPQTVEAREALEFAAEHSQELERLALDLAAARAFVEDGAPL
jgi:hypothetical protein